MGEPTVGDVEGRGGWGDAENDACGGKGNAPLEGSKAPRLAVGAAERMGERVETTDDWAYEDMPDERRRDMVGGGRSLVVEENESVRAKAEDDPADDEACDGVAPRCAKVSWLRASSMRLHSSEQYRPYPPPATSSSSGSSRDAGSSNTSTISMISSLGLLDLRSVGGFFGAPPPPPMGASAARLVCECERCPCRAPPPAWNALLMLLFLLKAPAVALPFPVLATGGCPALAVLPLRLGLAWVDDASDPRERADVDGAVPEAEVEAVGCPESDRVRAGGGVGCEGAGAPAGTTRSQTVQ